MTKAHTAAASAKANKANNSAIVSAAALHIGTDIHAASNATIAAGVTKAPAAEVISTPAAATKADKAREIFGQCYAASPVPARKDIINRAVTEAGLTKAGAATYLQNYKGKNGLVAKKSAAPTA